MDGGRVITCSCGMFELSVAARSGEMPGARLVELNAALARSYEAHRLLSGVDFSRDTADEAVEPCGQNPRFQLHRDNKRWPMSLVDVAAHAVDCEHPARAFIRDVA